MIEDERPAPAILHRSCSFCSRAFEHGKGARCPGCDRFFCNRHLYQSWPFHRLLRRKALCADCRAREGGSEVSREK